MPIIGQVTDTLNSPCFMVLFLLKLGQSSFLHTANTNCAIASSCFLISSNHPCTPLFQTSKPTLTNFIITSQLSLSSISQSLVNDQSKEGSSTAQFAMGSNLIKVKNRQTSTYSFSFENTYSGLFHSVDKFLLRKIGLQSFSRQIIFFFALERFRHPDERVYNKL